MRTPEWFDDDYYFAAKLAAMKSQNPAYTAEQLSTAFRASGFVGDEGLYRHFTAWGQQEELSPNSLFDSGQYYIAKTAQFYGKQSVSENEVQTVKGLIHNAGMNAWSHYTAYGAAEGVDPSNNFDSDAYLTAKLAQVRQAESPGMTMQGLNAALAACGLTPLSHFLCYGKDEGFINDLGQIEVASPVTVTPSSPVEQPPVGIPTIELSGAQPYRLLQADFPAGTGEGQVVLNSVTTYKGLYTPNVTNLTLYLRGRNVIEEDDTPYDDAIFGTNLASVAITGDAGASLTVEGVRAGTVDASALNGSLYISLSDHHATRVIGSQGNDIIETNGMADVITGGLGNDVFRIDADMDGPFSNWTLARTPIITDFSRGDRIDFSEASRQFQGFASRGQVAAGSESELVNILRDYLSGAERGILVAHHAGNTYLAANGDTWDTDDDAVVCLTGVYDQASLALAGAAVSLA